MSETHTTKLNLKALKHVDSPIEESTAQNIQAAKVDTPAIDTSNDEKTNKIEANSLVLDTIDSKPESLHEKISFASIRKQVNEDPKNIKVDETLHEQEKSPIASKTEVNIVPEENKIKTSTDEEAKDYIVNQVTTEKDDGNNQEAGQKKPLNINGVVKKIEEIKQTPEEIEAILSSAEEILEQKSKEKGIFGFLRRKKIISKNKNTGDKISKEKEVRFINYESHFKKESTDFLSRFQNFKYAPQTRIGLLISLIGMTIFIIGALMIIMPEKHSVQIYKANILQIIGKEQVIVKPPKEIVPQIEITEIPIKEENPEISKLEQSKEKLRQYLINKY